MGLIVPTLGKRKLILSSSSGGTANDPGNPAPLPLFAERNFHTSVNKMGEKFLVLWCHSVSLCCAHFNLQLLRFNKKYGQFARAASFMFFHSTSVNPPRTQVPVSCLGNQHMTILRALAERRRGSERGKGKLQSPLANLIKIKVTTLQWL